jgi:hypothetical protein
MILIDLTGKRFGRWVAISYANGRWLCQCDCGNQKSIVTASLRYGGSQSCGCLKNELAVQRYSTHRRRYTVEYSTWAGMIARCHNEESRDFEFYGKHGVIVCARWRGSFEEFLSDMGERPADKDSIDRFPDQNGNYEPGNCRWATAKEQARNRRDNVHLIIKGERILLVDACKQYKIPEPVVRSRLVNGWSHDAALTTPVRQRIKTMRQHEEYKWPSRPFPKRRKS